MSKLPTDLRNIALFLQRLPGIGEKTANRLAFYFLRMPQQELQQFSDSIRRLKEQTKLCKICKNLTELELCFICDDTQRDFSKITVVEDVLDLLSFETGDIYNGVYHVLHGKIDPLNSIGPDDIHLDSLFGRIDANVNEIILATNLDMEGEATAMFIRNKLEETRVRNGSVKVKVTRLAYGLPMGADLEYADYMTLKRAIDGRNIY